MSRFDDAMTDLCDVLRSKTDITRKISLAEIPYVIRSIPEYYDYDAVNNYLSGNMTTLDNPDITGVGIYAFRGYSTIISINLPLATSIETGAFYSCTALTSINLPLATSIGTYAFYGCTALKSINLPLATSIKTSTFDGCTALTSINLPLATSIGTYAFDDCTALKSIIIRTSTVCTLSSTNAFRSTPIYYGKGYIYVPSILVDSYKSATNWSTYSAQIRAIEDYPDITGG